MSLAGAGLVEDYREMILGEIAEQLDVNRLFTESRAGGGVSDEKVDEWVRGAVQSVERWKTLFSPALGMGDDTARLKRTLTSDDFKTAFQLACEAQNIALRETRNSQSQFVPGVFHFEIPAAFRDPVFRPSRTLHVAFDRNVYAAVRGQDLGIVRGQPIRPILAGFSEPVTDWLFQTAMNARAGESAFAIRAGKEWQHGPGVLFVHALRWLGRSRRLPTPDSISATFVKNSGESMQISAAETLTLARDSSPEPDSGDRIPDDRELAARKLAQQTLKTCAATRDAFAKGAAGLSLLLVASVHV
jgi:hypothetical protein